jgi:hypothetical protein
MTGAEAIALARRRGVALGVFLGNLRVYSEGEPDESLVRLLRDDKQAVVDAILAAETESDRRRRVLAEKIETVMTIRGLPRPDAEHEVFEHVVVEYARRIRTPIRFAAPTAASLRLRTRSCFRSGGASDTHGFTACALTRGARSGARLLSRNWRR